MRDTVSEERGRQRTLRNEMSVCSGWAGEDVKEGGTWIKRDYVKGCGCATDTGGGAGWFRIPITGREEKKKRETKSRQPCKEKKKNVPPGFRKKKERSDQATGNGGSR